ncbi:peptidyl-prolyl cis-trans isomerase [Rubritalea tangerina]|uniref:Peptidyl-prolyl cis-trans isomerase n=1 Tax=Rubritalea tangerina TaxID=430798 RepID=A0ABW4ZBK6_9BACT
MKKLVREPLLHFMLIGAGLFGLYSLVNQEEGPGEDTIVISEGRIEQFINVYEKTWQRPPTEHELKALIDDYVIEEIYYRQAVAMGIDQDDTIIRRRMRQKLEFLTDDVLMASDGDDSELEVYLSENPEKFRKDGSYSFEQIYINPQKHAGDLKSYLKEVEEKLQSGEEVESDSYFIAREQKEVPRWKVDRDFGQDFSGKLSGLKVGEWSGPLQSGLGSHFVKVSQRTEGSVPQLAEIRDKVKREWLHAQKLERRRQFNEKFLEKYEVVIEWPEQGSGA